MFRAVLAGLVAALALGGASPAPAEGAAPGSSPILTLDQERLFSGTIWGRRIQAELEAESTTLAGENRRLEAELTAEEASLTERRKTMEPAAFRAEADAFDDK